ncbi:DNA-directed DNA polymerase eta rad30 [Serendipita sp. 401]|nr:DNA-directed DNA polymerase eta rad30 [Serendipita sp. 401]KAG9057744.1 DNA-directed DNA polymerase eta rad30 [Serendipita sp. 407]
MKEDDKDEWNLNPVITYRHVLSQGSGVHNPLRMIGLCDMDAFYAQCEQKRLGIDPTLPLVVLQWDLLIAVNYPARKFGIKRMTKLPEARKMCPDLVVIHVATYKDGEMEAKYHPDPNNKTHKVSLDLYRRESIKIVNLFKSTLPTAEIEKASVDESFIDFTVPVQNTLLERYPDLASFPTDSPLEMDTPLPPPPQDVTWPLETMVIPILSDDEGTPEDAINTTTPHQESPTTWHDIGLSIAAELLAKVRSEILQTLGYTTSAGIARNKFLAKLAASYKKPASQSVLRNSAIPSYLRPMPFQKIRFLGGKLGAVIAEEYDVQTVGELLSISLSEIQRKFGSEALWVYQVFRGIDISEVKEKPPVNKSMLASKNLPKPIRGDGDVLQWVQVLCSELAVRLLEARETGTVWPKTIALHTRQAGDGATRSKQSHFPFVRNLTREVIVTAVMKLWKELHGTDAERAANPNVPNMKIINIAVSFNGVEALEQGQRGIEGFLGRERTQASTSTDHVTIPAVKEEPNEAEKMDYLCRTCKKTLTVPVERDDPEEIRSAKLESLKAEHEDYHFAQRLSRQDVVVLGGAKRRTSPGGQAAPKKKKRKEENITSYFQKK